MITLFLCESRIWEGREDLSEGLSSGSGFLRATSILPVQLKVSFKGEAPREKGEAPCEKGESP